jgi:hypothetical protein
MAASYSSMFAFGILLLASWAGWGAAIEKLILGRAVGDRALHMGWGLAFTVLLGGILNLAGTIGPIPIHLFLGGGLILLAWDCWRRRRRASVLLRRQWRTLRSRPVLAVAAVAVVGMLVAAYAAKVCSKDYNPHDDLQGYFVFPAKMIQTGGMGPDPFSEARLLSLGGMSFLQAMILSVADARYFRLIEPGVALPLAVTLLLGLARDARAGPWVELLAACLFLAVPPPAKNAASLVTGLVLFLVLFRTIWRVSDRSCYRSPRGEILVALTASALCALKTTHVPACVLTVVVVYLLWAVRERSRAVIGRLLLAGALTLVFVFPWMLASYESNGTLLYPFLGGGFHGSAYGGEWLPYEIPGLMTRLHDLWSATMDPKVAPLWILAGGLLVRWHGHPRPVSLWGLSVGGLIPFLALAGTHPGAYRYSWASLWAATLTLVVYSFRSAAATPRGRRAPLWSAAPLVVALGLLTLAHGTDAKRYWRSRLQRIEISIEQSRSPGLKRGAERNGARMLEAVPEGEVLLARLRYPFVLDFTRHTILTINYPGGSSPPPGMPFFHGAEPLAHYLCAQSVRYVAYSYRTEANFSREAFDHRLDPEEFAWTRTQARHALDFQDNLMQLSLTRRRIYDDGDIFVLDLAVSATGRPVRCDPTRNHASVTQAGPDT